MSEVHPATKRARRLRLEGKCIQCGLPRSCASISYCLICLKKARERDRERRGYLGREYSGSKCGPLTIEERMKLQSQNKSSIPV